MLSAHGGLTILGTVCTFVVAVLRLVSLPLHSSQVQSQHGCSFLQTVRRAVLASATQSRALFLFGFLGLLGNAGEGGVARAAAVETGAQSGMQTGGGFGRAAQAGCIGALTSGPITFHRNGSNIFQGRIKLGHLGKAGKQINLWFLGLSPLGICLGHGPQGRSGTDFAR